MYVAFHPLLLPSLTSGAAPWHPSMYGFNVTDQSYSYDNRPETPLINLPIEKWWFVSASFYFLLLRYLIRA